jgi:hypothetical protein
VLSDIGGQAALTFGISNTNIPIFTSGVADNDFLRIDGTSVEGRSASEVLSDIGAAPAAGDSNIVTTGALNSGSITSGFGAIDVGSSNITTTGTGSFGVVNATDGCTITTADNTAQLTLTSTDTDSGHGPRLNMVRNPGEAGADGDNLGQIFIQGYNDAGTPELIDYFQLFTEIADASDGTEDARQIHYVMTGGSQRSRIEHNATETVINEDSVDVDFRVESDGNANMLFVNAGDNEVGIGTNDPSATLHVVGNAIATTDTDTSNSGSVTLDYSTNQNFVLTLTGNVTLANPSTEVVGQSGFIVCIQDGTGSRTLSLGTDYETAGGAGITLSTAASATDIIPYVVAASGRILLGTPQLAFS